MPFCPNCGEEVKIGAKFCANCGAAMAPGSTPPKEPKKGGGISIEATLSYAGAAVLILISFFLILAGLGNPISFTILGLFLLVVAYKLIAAVSRKPSLSS